MVVGPRGVTFGLWEYLAQSNSNADCVNPEYRSKFVHDLTVLGKKLIVGLCSFNLKLSVPNDIPEHNQYIPAECLESHIIWKSLNCEKQKMILN